MADEAVDEQRQLVEVAEVGTVEAEVEAGWREIWEGGGEWQEAVDVHLVAVDGDAERVCCC